MSEDLKHLQMTVGSQTVADMEDEQSRLDKAKNRIQNEIDELILKSTNDINMEKQKVATAKGEIEKLTLELKQS
jgi:phosphoenolpyruvate-protein kinase (PTS system EI component)